MSRLVLGAALLAAVIWAEGASAEPRLIASLADLQILSNDANMPVGIDKSPHHDLVAVEHGGRISIRKASTGTLVRDLGEGEHIHWSPSGNLLAFLSGRGGSRQLWVANLTGGMHPVTAIDGGVGVFPNLLVGINDLEDLSWSPDSRSIVFSIRSIADEKSSVSTSGKIRRPVHIFSTAVNDKASLQVLEAGLRTHTTEVNHLFVADLRCNCVRQLTRGPASDYQPAWSPVGNLIAATRFSASDGSRPVNAWSPNVAADIVLLDAATGRVVERWPSNYLAHQPKWSPDGHQVAYLMSDSPADQYAPAIIVRRPGNPHATRRFDVSHRIMSITWDRDRHFLLLIYQGGLTTHAGLVSLDNGSLQELAVPTDEPTSVSSVTGDGHGDRHWWIANSPSHLDQVWTRSGGHPPRRIADLDLNAERAFRFGNVKRVVWQNSKGEKREGVLLFPPDYDPSKRYPIIVDDYPQYGGSEWRQSILGNQAWAASGYVVFRPRPPAPHVWMNNFGSIAYSHSSIGAEGWNVAVEYMLGGIKKLDDLGIADTHRMILYGFSNGGSVAAEMLSRTNLFRCAVIVSPALADWIRPGLLGEANFFAETYAREEGRPLAADYVALSPVVRIGSTPTKILLAAGERDYSPLRDAIELYNAFRIAGDDAELRIYSGEGHVFEGEAMENFWQRENAFFKSCGNP